MAKVVGKKELKKVPAAQVKGDTAEKLPDGWERVGISGPQNWYLVEEGNKIEGVLLSRDSKKSSLPGQDGMKSFFRIWLTAPGTKCSVKDRDSGESLIVEAEAGDIICVDERADLVDYRQLVPTPENRQYWLVLMNPIARVGIGGGQTFWKFTKGKRRYTGVIPQSVLDGLSGPDDDDKNDDKLPF